MPEAKQVRDFAKSNKQFRQVLAGQVSVQDFFTKKEFTDSKNAFMAISKEVLGQRPVNSMYSDENVAAAWISKIRYNQDMTDNDFKTLIDRSESIFNGAFLKLKLREDRNAGNGLDATQNDLCAIMWGIEALNGIQSFDSGATRVRFPPGIAPTLVKALEDAGSVPRASTHATCTKLVDKGLGKDIEDERLRAFTPRGMGALLVVPTSKDGMGGMTTATTKVSTGLPPDYDLLLKREDYGYNDTAIHTRVHTKVGFINHLTRSKQQYTEGRVHIYNYSDLAKAAQKELGKGDKIHRKEHLSELKGQSATLVNLLEAGKKEGLFQDFKTKWTIRIKIPPWEKKIVSSDPESRKGLGDFLKQIAQGELSNPSFAARNKANLDKVRGLLSQALEERFGSFKQCREGNEVLVSCESGKAEVLDSIAKTSTHAPVDRHSLVAMGMASEVDPSLALRHQHKLQEEFKQLREEQVDLDEDEARDDITPH